jgi:hypothetical protein
MANNRMYLVCDECGPGNIFENALFMGKRLGEGYYRAPNDYKLEQFYDDHEWCGNTLDHFSIQYETEKE